MSVKLMAMAFDVPKEILTSPQKFVLLALADNAWDDGTSCYPSRGLMAHKTNLSASSIDRALRALQDAQVIEPIGHTNMQVVEWQLNVPLIDSVMVPYVPQRPYPERLDPLPTVGIPPTQSDHQTVSEPSVEPTYVNDSGDGVPFEWEMELDNFLTGWKTCFPNKAQPRKSTTGKKFKTRFQNEGFRANWRRALWLAKDMEFAQEEGWFKWQWFLHNNENYEKLLDGTFDFKQRKTTLKKMAEVADPQGTADPNRHLPPRPE